MTKQSLLAILLLTAAFAKDESPPPTRRG